MQSRVPRGRNVPWYRRLWIVAVVFTVLVAGWAHWQIGGAWATTAFVDVTVTIGAVAAALALVAPTVRSTDRSARWGWALLAVGAGLEALGEASWTIYELGLGGVPYPGLPDVLYLGGYPFLAAGFLLLASDRQGPIPSLRKLLDGLLVGVALFTISWPLLMEPLIAASDVSELELVVSLAYPALDIVVGASAFVVAMYAPVPRRFPMALVAGGILAWMAGDSMFAYLEVTGSYTANALDATWVVGDVLIAMGALHPANTIAARTRGKRRRYRFLETIAPYAPFLGAVAVLGYLGTQARLGPEEIWLGATMLALFVARQALVLGDVAHLSRDLERSERRFREMAGNIDEVLWILGPDLERFEYVSPSFHEVYGTQPGQEPATLTELIERIHPEDRANVTGSLERSLALIEDPTPANLRELAGIGESGLRYRVTRPNGATRVIDTRATPVLDQAGRIQRLVGIASDVTDEIEAQRIRELAIERESQLEAIRETEGFKNRFINMAAHELLTPLTPLKFQIESVDQGVFGPLTEEEQAAMAITKRSVDRLEHLIRNLLDATAMQRGGVTVDRAGVDLGETVQTRLDDLEDRHPGVVAAASIEPNIQLVGDRERLGRALASLVEAMIDHAPADAAVRVGLSKRGDHARLSLVAPGLEMGEDGIAALFEPFEEVQEHALGQAEGSGLGPYVAQGIVEAHGGEVQVSGTPEGLRFDVVLPLEGEGTRNQTLVEDGG